MPLRVLLPPIHESGSWLRRKRLPGTEMSRKLRDTAMYFLLFTKALMPFLWQRNYILQLHKIMYSHMNNPMAGQIKNVQNYISATYPDGHTEILFTPLAAFRNAEGIGSDLWRVQQGNRKYGTGPLIAVPVFIHDFLCIHPFNDGNGRMTVCWLHCFCIALGSTLANTFLWKPRSRKTRICTMRH